MSKGEKLFFWYMLVLICGAFVGYHGMIFSTMCYALGLAIGSVNNFVMDYINNDKNDKS